jgi:hypothetical protein
MSRRRRSMQGPPKSDPPRESSRESQPEPAEQGQGGLPEGRRLPMEGTILLRGMVRHVGRGYQRVTIEADLRDLWPAIFDEDGHPRSGVTVHAPETLALATALDRQELERRLRREGL